MIFTEKYPPISPGTRVKTIQEDKRVIQSYGGKRESVQWGVEGEVLCHSDCHGLCYYVRHDDGRSVTYAWYEPTELKVITDER